MKMYYMLQVHSCVINRFMNIIIFIAALQLCSEKGLGSGLGLGSGFRPELGIQNCSDANGSTTPYIPFVDLESSAHNITSVDDHSERINLPSPPLLIGSDNVATAFVSSNGVISFGTSFGLITPQTFPFLQGDNVVAPYLDDIDLREKGVIRYAIITNNHPSLSYLLELTDDLVRQDQDVTFNASWLLIARWIDVCPFGNQNCNEGNNFQAVVATDGFQSFAVFTYQCGGLNWIRGTAGASIGFSARSGSGYAFANHPFSRKPNVNDIACYNQTCPPWSNVVYKISTKYIRAGRHVLDNSVCSTTLNESFYQRMMQVGNCSPYPPSSTNRVSQCDSKFTVGVDYVYVPFARVGGSPLRLRTLFEDLSASIGFIGLSSPQCLAAVSKALCVHFFLPCGSNSSIHIPRFLCPDTCLYLTDDVCRAIWPIAVKTLQEGLQPSLQNVGLDLPVCDNTSKIIASLNLSEDCCSNGGLVIPTSSRLITSSAANLGVTTQSLHHTLTPNTTTGLIISVSVGSTVGVVILATAVLVLLLVFIAVYVQKKKANIKLQVDMSLKQSGLQIPRIYVSDHDAASEPTASPAGVNMTSTLTLPGLQEPFRPRASSAHLRQLSNLIIPSGRLQLVETLGQGEFGIVYRALLLPQVQKNTTPEAVAVKTLKGQFSSDDISSIMEESLKMKSFDHVNVLNLLGVCVDTGSAPYIVMPLMSHGSLLSYLKKERHNLTVAEGSDIGLVLTAQKQLLSMCLQVAQGMAYLASQKFVHRDLAARNCMVAFNGVIKVADFGLAEDVYQRNYFRQDSTSVKLPIKWMAVESLHDRVFSEKSDVWSFGVTSWEVFSLGRMPYPAISPAEVVELLDSGSRLTQPTNAACSDEIFCVMMTCWKENPDKRPTFDELVNTISSILKPLADYMDFSDVYCKENNTEGSKYDKLEIKYDKLENKYDKLEKL